MKSPKSKPENFSLPPMSFSDGRPGWRTARFGVLLLLPAMAWFLLWAAVPGAASAKTVIKFATLAPEGTNWMLEMHQLDKEVQQATGGEVSFKFYPGGVAGDEVDVIRKIRIGQIHGGGFTGVGLGEILPESRVFDLPFLFHTDKEVEHVYEVMTDHFARLFDEKGYELAGWVPVGWVHFFSQHPIQTLADLRKSKPWMWEGDPLVRESYEALGVSPVPLSVTDVLLSLQTGIIDTVYASPVGALALQWFTKVKYMSELRMGSATGAVLISKKIIEKLSPEHQKAVREVCRKRLRELVRKIQDDNAKSIEAMKKSGLQLTPMPSAEEIKNFEKIGETVRARLTGKMFSKELLNQVLTHLKEAR